MEQLKDRTVAPARFLRKFDLPETVQKLKETLKNNIEESRQLKRSYEEMTDEIQEVKDEPPESVEPHTKRITPAGEYEQPEIE